MALASRSKREERQLDRASVLFQTRMDALVFRRASDAVTLHVQPDHTHNGTGQFWPCPAKAIKRNALTSNDGSFAGGPLTCDVNEMSQHFTIRGFVKVRNTPVDLRVSSVLRRSCLQHRDTRRLWHCKRHAPRAHTAVWVQVLSNGQPNAASSVACRTSDWPCCAGKVMPSLTRRTPFCTAQQQHSFFRVQHAVVELRCEPLAGNMVVLLSFSARTLLVLLSTAHLEAGGLERKIWTRGDPVQVSESSTASQNPGGDPRSALHCVWLSHLQALLATQWRSQLRHHLLRDVMRLPFSSFLDFAVGPASTSGFNHWNGSGYCCGVLMDFHASVLQAPGISEYSQQHVTVSAFLFVSFPYSAT